MYIVSCTECASTSGTGRSCMHLKWFTCLMQETTKWVGQQEIGNILGSKCSFILSLPLITLKSSRFSCRIALVCLLHCMLLILSRRDDFSTIVVATLNLTLCALHQSDCLLALFISHIGQIMGLFVLLSTYAYNKYLCLSICMYMPHPHLHMLKCWPGNTCIA